jgi:hypothetical protein
VAAAYAGRILPGRYLSRNPSVDNKNGDVHFSSPPEGGFVMRFSTVFMTVILGFSTFLYAGDGQSVSDDPKDNVKAADIAAAYNVSADSVDRLKATYSIGYGGISKAFALAQKSGLSVDAILQMKTGDKLGWGEIARRLELKSGEDYKAGAPDVERSEAKAEKQQARMEKRAEKRTEKKERSPGKGVK